MTNDEINDHPRQYVEESLAILGHMAEVIRRVDPELLEELAGGGAGLPVPPPPDDARRVIVELARASRAFVDAARAANERGLL